MKRLLVWSSARSLRFALASRTPTISVTIDRGTARIHRGMFPRYLQKLYDRKAFFDGTGTT